jgi:hypothetical protein
MACCNIMDELTKTVYFEIRDGNPYIIDQEWSTPISNEPIRYCPWCGKLIMMEVI